MLYICVDTYVGASIICCNHSGICCHFKVIIVYTVGRKKITESEAQTSEYIIKNHNFFLVGEEW